MSRKPIVAIDFDNTIVDWVDENNCVLKRGAVAAIQRLRDRNCFITIHTCRIGIGKQNGDLDTVVSEIRRILDEFGVPYDSIHLGTKVIADVYIDDRAVAFRGDWGKAVAETEALIFKRVVEDL